MYEGKVGYSGQSTIYYTLLSDLIEEGDTDDIRLGYEVFYAIFYSYYFVSHTTPTYSVSND